MYRHLYSGCMPVVAFSHDSEDPSAEEVNSSDQMLVSQVVGCRGERKVDH